MKKHSSLATPDLGRLELIDSRTTSLAEASPEKKWNVRVAAEHVDGTLVPPGGTFSFNEATGPQTVEHGFVIGYGIVRVDGVPRTVTSPGGGLCQVSSTLFHAVLASGFPVEARRGHSFWNPAYAMDGMVGTDVAVDDEYGLDFTWRNPTDGYVLVEARADDRQVTVALRGRKPGWTVSLGAPEVENVRPAEQETIVEPASHLPAGDRRQVEWARDGFDSAITRTVVAPGAAPRIETFRSSYLASRNIVLVGSEPGQDG
jgi:vancomycin resistance protein YoaR